MTDAFNGEINLIGANRMQREPEIEMQRNPTSNLMKREPSNISLERSMSQSKLFNKKKGNEKREGLNATNIENYKTYKEHEKELGMTVDPRGLAANGVFCAFSGVIESLQLFSNRDEDLKVKYQIRMNSEWHDETPQTSDSSGQSMFCSAKDGKVTFSLGFDTLVSCMYIESWPQLVLTLKGFDADGDIITRGYAQAFLPTTPGVHYEQAVVYQIVRNVKWYHSFLPFLAPNYIDYDEKQFDRVVCKGQGRQTEKIRCIGKIRIRAEVLHRNYARFGYK